MFYYYFFFFKNCAFFGPLMVYYTDGTIMKNFSKKVSGKMSHLKYIISVYQLVCSVHRAPILVVGFHKRPHDSRKFLNVAQ